MKSIIITGASSGIGCAAAELFLQNGWRVGLVARRRELLEEIAEGQPNAVALPADVTDAKAMEDAFSQFGEVDALFNNAGMFGPSKPIDEVALEDWLQVMGVNLNGMFIAARLAFGNMRQHGRGGRIINNGSISAHTPRENSVCYTTTKHAITGLTKSLALDGRPFDITAGQIDIGNAESAIVTGLKAGNPDMHTMDVGHAAASVLHMAQLPLGANIPFMTVMATKMPYLGRG
ncbi:SDR family oxidoreductase [Sulfitobacter donghicola]|uniref:3-oxoacyl-ACP reductase n=1 Tax=Sulfitobacter donghicola DSW-25 = KCTC 12864 = JCM 14565 TaxID=1300350 RepID=A0A073IWK3_9RHOB|nr:SDR family oxidoreductase [Sulfitobacter donghicola]KEJ89762.1 3-oxoacyl-ACP reductase [Sulfitobacter donghicola DSW-25 = KCTC 12864 = JCM 14565]KIN67133.1 Short-chain dehydrogenase/reductase SDR [Sulfitobacter donghicola DSW-25 = KCTC 12864 = JCM 14565]